MSRTRSLACSIMIRQTFSLACILFLIQDAAPFLPPPFFVLPKRQNPGWVQGVYFVVPPMHPILICNNLAMPFVANARFKGTKRCKCPNPIDQNNPHFFVVLLESAVFLLLFDVVDFGAETEEMDEPPDAADEMAASRSFARSSPCSAACTYHRLDSIVSRRQPMPISVK